MLMKVFVTGVGGQLGHDLINELTKEDNLEKAGGPAYIASLTNEVPSSSNIEVYAKIVIDRFERRELIRISSEMRSTSFELNTPSENLIENAEKKIFDVMQNKNQKGGKTWKFQQSRSKCLR